MEQNVHHYFCEKQEIVVHILFHLTLKSEPQGAKAQSPTFKSWITCWTALPTSGDWSVARSVNFVKKPLSCITCSLTRIIWWTCLVLYMLPWTATGVGTCWLTTLDVHVGVLVCALLTAATDYTGFGVVWWTGVVWRIVVAAAFTATSPACCCVIRRNGNVD